jgi:hypothetical protein
LRCGLGLALECLSVRVGWYRKKAGKKCHII